MRTPFSDAIVVFHSIDDCNFYWIMERNCLKEEKKQKYVHYNNFFEQKEYPPCENDNFSKIDENNNNSIQFKLRSPLIVF